MAKLKFVVESQLDESWVADGFNPDDDHAKDIVVHKHTEAIHNLIILASDVNYHVVRYARIKTIRSTFSCTHIDEMRATAIKQCRQLIKLLQEMPS